MGDDKVIGAKIARGEIEVDQPGDAVAEHQDIVGKEVGMDDMRGQIGWPVRVEMAKLVIDDRLQPREHGIEIARTLGHRAPMTLAHAVFARAGIGFERAVPRDERTEENKSELQSLM